MSCLLILLYCLLSLYFFILSPVSLFYYPNLSLHVLHFIFLSLTFCLVVLTEARLQMGESLLSLFLRLRYTSPEQFRLCMRLAGWPEDKETLKDEDEAKVFLQTLQCTYTSSNTLYACACMHACIYVSLSMHECMHASMCMHMHPYACMHTTMCMHA